MLTMFPQLKPLAFQQLQRHLPGSGRESFSPPFCRPELTYSPTSLHILAPWVRADPKKTSTKRRHNTHTHTHTDESSTCLSGVVRGREKLSHRPLLTYQGNFNIVLRSPTCSSSKKSSKVIEKMTDRNRNSSKTHRTCVGNCRNTEGHSLSTV